MTDNRTRERVAIVGTGARAEMFTRAVATRDHLDLVALCDPSPTRMAYHNRVLADLGRPGASTWAAEDFEPMLGDERPGIVVVTTMDATHDAYIVPALRAGARVVTEKPMVTDTEKAQRVVDALTETGGRLTVAFNYRFNPVHRAVREAIAGGEIGEVVSVHFEWLLDTHHGADYFRRWHRRKEHSGGLMVHKSGHHFDLVNWWIDAAPETVFGLGRLAFYGAANGERRGLRRGYERAHGSPESAHDPFALRLADNPALRALYLDAEADTGYQRDRNVFNDDITIEDDMAVLVRYDTGATMTYHLTAYSPWEGYRVMINGTGGRLELEVEETRWAEPHTLAEPSTAVLHGEAEPPNAGEVRLRVRPLWAPPRDIEVTPDHGGHGGADERMLAAIFDSGAPFAGILAGVDDGIAALLIGAGANASFASGQPVDVTTLMKG